MAASSSSKPLCLVRSSINIDSMFAVQHVVRPGETISSSSMEQRPGGKGANVCAAVALAEQDVVMSGAVGKDATWPIDELKKRGAHTASIRVLDSVPTGRAFIQVAEDGENSIVLLKGANFHPDKEADDPAKVISSLPRSPTHMILQNEIPLATTKAFLKRAHQGSGDGSTRHCTTVFNPSPMLSREELQDFAWNDVDVLIVNEGEGEDLVNAMSAKGDTKEAGHSDDVLQALASLDALDSTSWIVMTRGARGVSAIVRTGEGSATNAQRSRIDIDASKPRQVQDTTGAGDTFAGNLVAGMMRHHGKHGGDQAVMTESAARDILQFAGMAAALAVETNGAMESIPCLKDVRARQAATAA